MRIAVLGGSFNPPHVGHGMIAAWLQWTGQVDAVWLVPAFEHAFGKPLAPWEQRLAATRELARLVGPWACVSDVEANLPRPSYTIHTLDRLREQNPGSTFRLVIGADVREQFPAWREHERILAEFSPIVVGRPGCTEIEGTPTFPDISSTVIRERLARGETVDGLVPTRVLSAWIGSS